MQMGKQQLVLQAKELGGFDLLTPRKREVIELRYCGSEIKTLEEVGKHFGVSRERIRQIEKRIVSRMKAFLKKSGIDVSQYDLQKSVKAKPVYRAVVNKNSRFPVFHGAFWTSEEDDALIKEFENQLPLGEMMRIHNRTKGGIRSRLLKLGLVRPLEPYL